MSLLSIALATAEPLGEVRVGLGAVVLTVALVGFLVWVGYLVLNARRRNTPQIEATPPNMQPWLSDDELENNRLTRVLGAAVISAAVLAISLPLYYANESNRQVSAEVAFDELYVEEGEQWWESFSCVQCHGPEAGGGGAPFTEARSGVSVSWSAPSLDDVFFRFSPDEIQMIINFGRPGTPMPANGLPGGGPMTVQEVEQVMAFLEHLQLDQGEVLDKIENAISLALSRVSGGEATVAGLIAEQETARADVATAPERFEVIEFFPDDLEALFAGAVTCTAVSAELISKPCNSPGQDTDRDGLSDDAERALMTIVPTTRRTVLERNNQLELVEKPAYAIAFATDDGFTNATPTGAPIPDIEAADSFMTALRSDHLTLSVQTARQDTFLAGIDAQIAYLHKAQQDRLWDLDLSSLAQAMARQSASDASAVTAETGESVGGKFYSIADAERAVGLFNAYCARCHTAGYSAGLAFEQGHGSGAWGPSLRDGRAKTQFPLSTDHVTFVIRGTAFAETYGVNGLGSGRMPAFGQILTRDDIELIVAFERTL